MRVMKGIVDMRRGDWNREVGITEWVAVCSRSIESLPRQASRFANSWVCLLLQHIFLLQATEHRAVIAAIINSFIHYVTGTGNY